MVLECVWSGNDIEYLIHASLKLCMMTFDNMTAVAGSHLRNAASGFMCPITVASSRYS